MGAILKPVRDANRGGRMRSAFGLLQRATRKGGLRASSAGSPAGDRIMAVAESCDDAVAFHHLAVDQVGSPSACPAQCPSMVSLSDVKPDR